MASFLLLLFIHIAVGFPTEVGAEPPRDLPLFSRQGEPVASPSLEALAATLRPQIVTVMDPYEKKEAALYKALDYLTFYELRDYSQEVAANITKYDALVERAIIMLAPELANANSIAASPLVVKESSSVKQGLVAESKEYARPSADRFPQVTALLQPILVSSKLGGNGLMRIIRN